MARAKSLPLKGEWAVVTGASGGIGLEFCRVLASKGCNLVMVAIEHDLLEGVSLELARRYGVEVRPLTIDLTREDAPGIVAGFVDAKGIEPYILINNAGIFSFKAMTGLTQRQLNRYIDLHMRATTHLCHLFGHRMQEKRRGRILNMSSMSCWMPMPGIAMYSATKAYLRVLSRAMYYEMRDYGVTVTVACPGGIATDLFGLPDNLKRLGVRLGVLQTPERFAAKAVKRMLRGRRQYINGWLNRVSIVAVGASPTWVRMLVKRKLLDKSGK